MVVVLRTAANLLSCDALDELAKFGYAEAAGGNVQVGALLGPEQRNWLPGATSPPGATMPAMHFNGFTGYGIGIALRVPHIGISW